jgi:hypothetical protein
VNTGLILRLRGRVITLFILVSYTVSVVCSWMQNGFERILTLHCLEIAIRYRRKSLSATRLSNCSLEPFLLLVFLISGFSGYVPPVCHSSRAFPLPHTKDFAQILSWYSPPERALSVFFYTRCCQVLAGMVASAVIAARRPNSAFSESSISFGVCHDKLILRFRAGCLWWIARRLCTTYVGNLDHQGCAY